MTARFAIIGKFVAKPGRGGELLEALRAEEPIIRDEPRTLCCVINVDAKEPDVIWAFEMFTDEAGWREHEDNPAIGPIAARVIPLLAEPFMIRHLAVDWAKGHHSPPS
jgi:quinol monooxygenase YgiN